MGKNGTLSCQTAQGGEVVLSDMIFIIADAAKKAYYYRHVRSGGKSDAMDGVGVDAGDANPHTVPV
jgi:hypothetical protein